MPIIRCKNYVEVYRQKAKSRDVHELSGRTGRIDLTRFVSAEILKHFQFSGHETLVDIGCGDGTLMKLASPNIARGVGILPTREEVERLAGHLGDTFKNLSILEGVAGRTGLDEGTADIVICNGVLLLLDSQKVDEALKEMVRIGKPGARVFIGELPFLDEFANRPYGNSISKWLYFTLRTRGVKFFIRSLWQVCRAGVSDEPFVVLPKQIFFESENDFITRANRFGLEPVSSFPHMQVESAGKICKSESRMNYLFQIQSNEEECVANCPKPTCGDFR